MGSLTDSYVLPNNSCRMNLYIMKTTHQLSHKGGKLEYPSYGGIERGLLPDTSLRVRVILISVNSKAMISALNAQELRWSANLMVASCNLIRHHIIFGTVDGQCGNRDT